MTFTQLRDEVAFEAGDTGLANLETVAGIIIEEVLNKYTYQIKYSELFVRDTALALDDIAFGRFFLPADYQHIDWDSLRFRTEGDVESQIILKKQNRVSRVNEGSVRFFTRSSGKLTVWPFAELGLTDTLVLDYWRKSNAKANNLIVPDQLVQTVKDESIGRLATTLGNKNGGLYMAMSRDSHAASLGATELPSAND